MKSKEQYEKRKIIKRFILSIAIWMMILVIITFVQNDYSRGLFFLVAIGVSLVYFAISCFIRPKKSDTGIIGPTTSINPIVEKDVIERSNLFTIVETFLLPGWILGSLIFGIFSLRQKSD